MKYVIIFLMFASTAFAVEPDEMLADPVLEARAQEIDQQIRCMQCVSEIIASSNAGWAADARGVVRELILSGKTDDEVYDYFVEKYGDKVLMKPRLRPFNYFLWFAGPLLLVLGGLGAVAFIRKHGKAEADTGLSEDEQKKLARLLQD